MKFFKLPLYALMLICSASAHAQDRCVKDPSPNEPQCNWESRVLIAKRYGFSEMSRGEMNVKIDENSKFRAERDREYELCMKLNNFCR
jgi:hypothetical protein